MPRTQRPILQQILLVLFTLTILISCDNKVQTITKKIDLTPINKLLEKGQDLYQKQEFDSSYYYYNKARNAAEQVQDTSRIIHALAMISFIQTNRGDYTGSENTSVEALSYLGNKHKFLYGEANIYHTLAKNYLCTYEYINAIYYFKKTINSKTDLLDKANMENNVAFVLTQIGKTDEALSMYKVLLTQKEVYNEPETYSRILTNTGYCYMLKKSNKALPYLEKALRIKLSIKDDWGIISTYSALSDYYKEINTKKAKKYALIYYQRATKVNSVDFRLESLKQLINITDGSQLKKYSTLYITLNDSLTKARLHAKNSFAKIKYDSKKEKEENIRLKEQKAANLLQLEIQKTKTEGLFLLILVLLIATAFIYYYLRVKNRREKIQASYITEIQIAKKLHDELANDVYQMMKFTETQDLSAPDNKELLLQNMDTIYARTRNISKENGNIETGIHFTEQLKEMISGFTTASTNVIVNNSNQIEWHSVTAEKKITLYRIIQELLVNMKKHSQCSLAIITFEPNHKTITIKYTDNGLGVNLQNIKTKNGLQNVENRIEAINGTITFDSSLNKGFHVNISIPS